MHGARVRFALRDMNLKISNVTLREAANSYVLLTAVDDQHNEIVIELSHAQAEFLEDELFEANRRRRENASAAANQDMPRPGHGYENMPQPGQGYDNMPKPGQGYEDTPQPGQGYEDTPQPGQVNSAERLPIQRNEQYTLPIGGGNLEFGATLGTNHEIAQIVRTNRTDRFMQRKQADPRWVPRN